VADAALPIILDQSQAKGIGERRIQEAWVERETAAFTLRPSLVRLDPGDEVELTVEAHARRLRLVNSEVGYGARIQSVACDPSLYDSFVGLSRGISVGRGIQVPGQALMILADLPMLTSLSNPWSPHAGAYASPWAGAVNLYKSQTTSGYVLDTVMSRRAGMGVSVTAFSAGPEFEWDYANVLRVNIFEGTLQSVDELAVLGGANALAIENQDGEWEVIQFQIATLVAPQTWDVSKLLRGQLGTEAQMRNPVPAGARVLVLDENIYQVNLPQSQYALPFYFRWGPDGTDIGDDSYQTQQKQFKGAGMRPYSPVHMKGVKDHSNNDVALSWIRRDRIGGDAWEQTEIAMSEASEAYEVDIYNGANVVRTLQTSTPFVNYTAAMQTADFGAPPASFDVKVFQMSNVVGRGTGRRVTINA
jgi:hypothetical protein